jgi:hypothetical protein
MQRKALVLIHIMALALWAACSSERSSTPMTPSASSATGSGGTSSIAAASDGSTLKASAPRLMSPIGNARLDTEKATLVIQQSTTTYSTATPLNYRVQLMNTGGAVLEERTGSGTSFLMNTTFDFNTQYRWRARAELEGSVGPWSTTESFLSIEKVDGYIRGTELYDPLTEGKTIGAIHGPVTFIPGVGARLEAESSYIEYMLPTYLINGQYSALVTNVGVISNNEDPKDRLITMREGDAAINDNIYRMSVDKRGNGAIAWRFLTGPGEYIETIGSERRVYSWHESLTYFVQATWINNFFNVLIKEGGVDGNVIYDYGKPYTKQYTPAPHMVFAGSPYKPGDRGDASTVAGMIIRQIWVSGNPRPAFANK